ncbi:solute carrier family 35 member F1-like [Schistocerca gregaria]|uniref:solute carrier family 35 member F1-like n=1 Tax=Schistocerca gregaria TaxID=7010 RepID=UPI00211ED840|nr:solute carrier family 35 member F1-like [Schistocerca gregaria]
MAESTHDVATKDAGNYQYIKQKLMVLLVGQIASCMIAGTSIISYTLANEYNIDMPAMQSFLNYLFLFAIYGSIYCANHSFGTTFRKKWMTYLFLAFVDVEANYCIVKAFGYNSLVTVMLFDCATIFFIVLLTMFYLKIRYNWRHFLGIILCVVGVSLQAITGYNKEEGRLIGNFLGILSSILYAISNIGQEKVVKDSGILEFLAFIGFFGVQISGLQVLALEHQQILQFRWNWSAVGLFLGFVCFMYVLYSLTPYIMKFAGSTWFNLSLRTSNGIGAVFEIYVFKKNIYPIYWLFLSIVIIGLCIYHINKPPKTKNPTRDPQIPAV